MQRLKNKNIYYIVCGASKADKAEKIIKGFLDEGAKVYTIPTAFGTRFLDLKRLKSLKNNTVKADWDSKIKLPREDAIVIAPCTFNTLNSIARGDASTYPLCLVASAIGNKTPVFVALAMNESLWNHPIVMESIKRIESWGCKVIWPEISQKGVTMIDTEKILDTVFFDFKRIRYQSVKSKDKNLKDKLILLRSKHLPEFIKIGRYLAQNELNLHTAGFVSVRVEDGILITSTGSDISNLASENLTLITSFDEGKNKIEWVGDLEPSSESPLSCVIHSAPANQYLLHFHSPLMTYNPKLEGYQSKNYESYGTFAIGHEALSLLNRHSFCILKYHGEVITGDHCDVIISKVETISSEQL